MSRINKTQKYAILWLHNQGMNIEDISVEITVAISQVKNVIENFETKAEKTGIKTKSEPVNAAPRSKNLMITETANKNKHVAIMTKEASQLNDELKKNVAPPTKSKNYIYRPNGN